MKRPSPKKLRRQSRNTITGNWAIVNSGEWVVDSGDTLFYDGNTTTVTLPAGSFSGFQVGDIITITNRAGNNIKKKRKVHVARRRNKEKLNTHTITEVSPTTMTVSSNELVMKPVNNLQDAIEISNLYSFCRDEWS